MRTLSNVGERAARQGRLIGAAGAAVLLLSLFIPWYTVDFPPGNAFAVNGWEVFRRLDVALAVLAGLALVTSFVRPRLIGIDVFVPTLIAARFILGAVGCVLVVDKLVNLPLIQGEVAPTFGAYLGLAACMTVTLSAVLDWTRKPTRPRAEALP